MLHALSRLVAVVLLVSPVVAADPEKPIVPAKDTVELVQRFTEILNEHKVPGMCVVIANRDGIVWTAGIGKADVASGKSVTPDTLFRIGSISKTFVALAALKLVEEGRLNLDAPVRSLVPEVRFSNPWEATSPVRVVHLLEHTTGWDDIHFKEYANNDPKPLTLAEGLALCPEGRTSRWRPGTRFSYCNSGPAVTAAIIEKVTGQRFEAYVEENFFKPIGLVTADYFLSPRAQSLLTNLYHADGRTPYPYWHVVMRPSGSINASAREMGSYLRFFLRRGEVDGRRILNQASIVRMETPATGWGAHGGLKTGYALHNYCTLDDLGFVWHGHNGGVEGGLAELAYLPEQGVGYFCSINSGEGNAFEEISKEIKLFATKDLPRPALPPGHALPATIVKAYSGWYHPFNPRSQALAFLEPILGLTHVSLDGATMHVKPLLGPSIKLTAVDDRRFRGEKQAVPRAVLMDTDDGRLLVATMTTAVKVSPAVAWIRIVLTALFVLAVITVPLFALVWGIRWLFRGMRGVPNLHVRALPLLAVLTLGALVGILMISEEDFLTRFGNRTLWSMSLTALTYAFAATSLASLWAAVRANRPGMNRWAYFHSLAASVILVIATLYMAWWGVIGYRSWN